MRKTLSVPEVAGRSTRLANTELDLHLPLRAQNGARLWRVIHGPLTVPAPFTQKDRLPPPIAAHPPAGSL